MRPTVRFAPDFYTAATTTYNTGWRTVKSRG